MTKDGSPRFICGAGTGGAAHGGALDSTTGSVEVIESVIERNACHGGSGGEGQRGNLYSTIGSGGGLARGGALTIGGTGIITRSQFQKNNTQGGTAGAGQSGYGCPFECPGNISIPPGDGGIGGSGEGGAVYATGSVQVDSSAFVENAALGGFGGSGGVGDPVSSRGDSNTNPGAGGAGGAANGGGISNHGGVSVRNSTLVGNSANGGSGGVGGAGTTQYLFGAIPLICNAQDGGSGGTAGDAKGGAIDNAAFLRILHCTIATNHANSGSGGVGGDGGPELEECRGTLGAPGAASIPAAGGIWNRNNKSVRLSNTLLARNLAGESESNATGVLEDDGHNLSSDLTCNFSHPTSFNGVDPKLGATRNHDGSTSVIPIDADSPARDRGELVVGGRMDQRGIFRGVGGAPDIGAFEYDLDPVASGVRIAGIIDGQLVLRWQGGPTNQLQRLRALSLGVWEDVPQTELLDTIALPLDASAAFYRALKK